MFEIPEKCEFDVTADQVELRTATNGNFIEIRKINLSQDNAATLAFLINHPNHLTIEVKIKED